MSIDFSIVISIIQIKPVASSIHFYLFGKFVKFARDKFYKNQPTSICEDFIESKFPTFIFSLILGTHGRDSGNWKFCRLSNHRESVRVT